MRRWWAFVPWVLFPALARAGGGFAVPHQSTEGMGQADAVTARATGPDAIYYNPAGLAGQRGLGFAAGVQLIDVDVAFTSAPGLGADDADGRATVFSPHVYVSHGLDGRTAIGLGVFPAYATGGRWPEGWAGRELQQDFEITSLFVQPTLAYRITPKVSAGLGIAGAPMRFTGSRVVAVVEDDDPDRSDGDVEVGGRLDGSDLLLVPVFGLAVGPFAGLRGGARVQLPAEARLLGSAEFSDQPPELEETLRDQPFLLTGLGVPLVVQLGVALERGPLAVELDVDYTAWSAYGETELRLGDVDAPEGERERVGTSDTLGVTLGAELDLSRWSPRLRGRAGIGYQQGTFRDEARRTPAELDPGHLLATLGASVRVRGWDLHVALRHARSGRARSTYPHLPGTYDMRFLILSLGATWAR